MIQSIAVLGAGLTGAQIAAMFANCGLQVYLYDEAPADDVSLAAGAIELLAHIKPAPIKDVQALTFLHPKNYRDDLHQLAQVDLIIDCVEDNEQLKQSVYEKIGGVLGVQTMIGTNTSSLSVTRLATYLPQKHQNRFLGIHFFSPPRYLPLVELTPHASTSQNIFDTISAFLADKLQKKQIVTQDTPGFIANRVGIFALANTISHALKYDLSPDCVDALTGKHIGRSNSATFATLDFIGLDHFLRLNDNLNAALKDDPCKESFITPDWLKQLIHRGSLGVKTDQGVFCKQDAQKLVWDYHEKSYRQGQYILDVQLAELIALPWDKKIFALHGSKHKLAYFLWECIRDTLLYASMCAEQVARSVADIDNALKWGYAWDLGPFEIWQQSGWHDVANLIQQDIENGQCQLNCALPKWVHRATFQGAYLKEKAFSVQKNDYVNYL